LTRAAATVGSPAGPAPATITVALPPKHGKVSIASAALTLR